MKVAILLYQNIQHAPFLRFYTQLLEKNNVEYDVVFLNRNPSLAEDSLPGCISIKWFGKRKTIINKLFSALRYKRESLKILKKNRYDFVFVLTTMPGVLLCNYLVKKYDKKYVFDVRDYTKEHYGWYFDKERKLVSHSVFNVISSPDFKRFLPNANYHVCHNCNFNRETDFVFHERKHETIKISYIGSIQYIEYCLALIELVVLDDRFELAFYGNEAINHKVSEKVKDLRNSRITFKGPFAPSKKSEIYEESDIVFNCYGNDNNIVRFAISNKYYDAAFHCKPLLVSPNTTMERLLGKFSFSIDFNVIHDLNSLFDWYNNLDKKEFAFFCKNIIEKANEDNNVLERIISNEIK